MSQRGNYSIEEVTALVEGYEELTSLRHKAWIQVRILDMWRAYSQIPREYQAAVLLMGFLGMSSRNASPLAYVSHSTVARRYASGLSAMMSKMNGASYFKANRKGLEGNRAARHRRELVKS